MAKPLKPIEIILHDQKDYSLSEYNIPNYLVDAGIKFFKDDRRGNTN